MMKTFRKPEAIQTTANASLEACMRKGEADLKDEFDRALLNGAVSDNGTTKMKGMKSLGH